METIAEHVNNGLLNAEIIYAESEHSALSSLIGASLAGARTFTATASQGLEYMHEVLHLVSGTRLPIVMVIANRALSSPINIWGDQSDAFNCRDTSWIQLFCKNTQESFDTVIQAYKLAESMKLPVMINIDGFTLSHLIEPVELLNQKQVNSFLPKKVQNLLDINKPNTIGPVAFPNSYQEFKHQQKDAMLNSIKEIKNINFQFNKRFKRSYGNGLIEIYGKNKDKMIIALGSVCNTIEDMIDNGEKISLLRIRSYRPFPIQEIIQATKSAKEIIVLDRSYSYGLSGPLFSEISSILKNKKIKSGIVGLGGRDITPETIKKIINSKKQEKWDDVYDT